ncbi:MAG: hypothetical protein F7C35_04345 [Desulfurococcales archaeon]|nr:hypothetical protein [Desulfurococcales archaeon]
MAFQDLLALVQDATNKVTALAWALFLFTWSLGWTLRGSPIPIGKLKRMGGSLVEDSVWAAFWLAVGSTVFNLIVYLVNLVTGG